MERLAKSETRSELCGVRERSTITLGVQRFVRRLGNGPLRTTKSSSVPTLLSRDGSDERYPEDTLQTISSSESSEVVGNERAGRERGEIISKEDVEVAVNVGEERMVELAVEWLAIAGN